MDNILQVLPKSVIVKNKRYELRYGEYPKGWALYFNSGNKDAEILYRADAPTLQEALERLLSFMKQNLYVKA